MANRQTQVRATRLSNGDIWMPNYGDGEGDSNVQVVREIDQAQQVTVDKVIEQRRDCPWCGQEFKGNGWQKRFETHLTTAHSDRFKSPEEQKQQAFEAQRLADNAGDGDK